MRDLLERPGLERSDNGEFVRLRQDRGGFLARPRSRVRPSKREVHVEIDPCRDEEKRRAAWNHAALWVELEIRNQRAERPPRRPGTRPRGVQPKDV